MYNCQVITEYGPDLTEVDINSFWKQGVCMDDWDIILLFDNPNDVLIETEEEVEDEFDYSNYADFKTLSLIHKNKIKVKIFKPKNYTIEQLLQGCCDNKWYKGFYRGKEYAIGISYHA